MVATRYDRLLNKIATMIEQRPRRAALYAAMKRGRDSRAQALARLEHPEQFRHAIRQLKEQAVVQLHDLMKEFTVNATRRGAVVYLAHDARDAVRYVLELAQAHGVRRVAKSKSLTSEEIELNHPLEEAGLDVVETDLGERIIQLAREKPYHLVYPAVHRTVAEVAHLLSEQRGTPVPSDLQAILQVIRHDLREVFLTADMGVSGGNVAIAETGTIVIETNEGNGRLVTSIPRIYVAIVGIEKIVPRLEDALKLIVAHPLSASGQYTTNYVSFLTGRSPFGGKSEGREFHVVLLDNGRTGMRNDSWFREALYCIRCGACMNICPTYGVVGGHVFGYIYPGPIGIPWTAQAHGLERAGDFAPLCIACGLCKEICPAEIDIPMMIARVKQLDLAEHEQLLVNRVLADSERFARFASTTAPLSNWFLRRGFIRYLMQKLVGIERGRPLPAFHRETFVKWWQKYTPQATGSAVRKVAYFVDLYANYNEPRLAERAVKLLEKLAVQVAVPSQQSAGMPYVAYGELEKARAVAGYNVMHLAPLVRDGYRVITTEPTAAYMLRLLYPRLLETAEAKLVGDATVELFTYLEELVDNGVARIAADEIPGERLGFHLPCHQRAVSQAKPTLRLLRQRSFVVEVIETGTCCGMAGTFGLKTGPLGYQLSMAVGQPLFDLFRESGVQRIVTESSVCKMHLEHGTGLPVVHPLDLLEDHIVPSG